VLRACVAEHDSGSGRQIFIVRGKFLCTHSNVGIKERKLYLVLRLEIQALLRDVSANSFRPAALIRATAKRATSGSLFVRLS
jgi:hypothetical protein